MERNRRTTHSRIVHNSKNKTGYTGVAKHFNDYVALIKLKGKTYRIGIYATAHEAHRAYLKTAKALGLEIKVKP